VLEDHSLHTLLRPVLFSLNLIGSFTLLDLRVVLERIDDWKSGGKTPIFSIVRSNKKINDSLVFFPLMFKPISWNGSTFSFFHPTFGQRV
jgi:hypothetical protein